MICLGIHSNVMLRFMVQAFQDPRLCSSAVYDVDDSCRMALKAESVLLVALLLVSQGNTEPLFLGKIETLSSPSQVVFDLRNLNVLFIFFS